MRFYWFVLGTLAVWRIAHLLSAEDGPWNLIARLRRKAGDGQWGQLLDCFYCLSLWVALPFVLLVGETVKEQILLWLAFSGGAIVIERATSREPIPEFHIDDGGQDHVMLRKKEDPASWNDRQSGT